MTVNVKAGETKNGRLAPNAIGGVSGYICINEMYDINIDDLGLLEKGDSLKLYNWANYSYINPIHSLCKKEQIEKINLWNKKCNISKRESYQGNEEYILTRTGRSTVKIQRIS